MLLEQENYSIGCQRTHRWSRMHLRPIYQKLCAVWQLQSLALGLCCKPLGVLRVGAVSALCFFTLFFWPIVEFTPHSCHAQLCILGVYFDSIPCDRAVHTLSRSDECPCVQFADPIPHRETNQKYWCDFITRNGLVTLLMQMIAGLALLIVPAISLGIRSFGKYLRELSHKTQAAAALAASIAEVWFWPHMMC